MELAPDLPRVLGDRVQLQQVLINLILNGIEAMSEVTDWPRELVVGTKRHGRAQVLTEVRDAGVGFDPAHIDQFFAAFQTTKPGGLGMGLAISRSIVENHGGQLWANANEGGGATFQFTLATESSAQGAQKSEP
jgi:C4-dicarboxylate-specific signal transduction histidine kinase